MSSTATFQYSEEFCSAINDFCEDESVFLSQLHKLFDVYLRPMKDTLKIPLETLGHIFLNLEVVAKLHKELAASCSKWSKIKGRERPSIMEPMRLLFHKRSLLETYLSNIGVGIERCLELQRSNAQFQRFLDEQRVKHGNMYDALSLPVLRIRKYPLYLKKWARLAPPGSERKALLSSVTDLEEWIEQCAAKSREDAEEFVKLSALQQRIEGFDLYKSGRKFIHEKKIQVAKDHFSGSEFDSTRSDRLKSGDLKDRQLFLFNDCFIICTHKKLTLKKNKLEFQRYVPISKDLRLHNVPPERFPHNYYGFAVEQAPINEQRDAWEFFVKLDPDKAEWLHYFEVMISDVGGSPWGAAKKSLAASMSKENVIRLSSRTGRSQRGVDSTEGSFTEESASALPASPSASRHSAAASRRMAVRNRIAARSDLPARRSASNLSLLEEAEAEEASPATKEDDYLRENESELRLRVEKLLVSLSEANRKVEALAQENELLQSELSTMENTFESKAKRLRKELQVAEELRDSADRTLKKKDKRMEVPLDREWQDAVLRELSDCLNVGKTSLLMRYVNNNFTIKTKSTIGADFLTKEIDADGKPVTLQIWDTAGQERFQGLGTSFFRGSDGVIFVFDVTRKNTFDALDAWRKSFLIQTNQEGNEAFPTLIVANKVDMENRVVSKEDVEKYTDKRNLPFYETSAKEAINVERAFEAITNIILSRKTEDDLNYDTVDLSWETKKKGCDC